MRYLSTEYDGEVLFTYDVMWDYTTMPWTQRYEPSEMNRKREME